MSLLYKIILITLVLFFSTASDANSAALVGVRYIPMNNDNNDIAHSNMITILDKQGRVVNQVNSILEVVNIQVPRTHLTRSASDHLPLIVDLKLI
jgi:hypothetical protein